MYAPVDCIHVISMTFCVVLGGCIYSIIMYLTTNDFNHDKSQPDHTSQNMHVMVFMKPVLTNMSKLLPI